MKTENSQMHCRSTKNQTEPRELPAICLQYHENHGKGTAESN